ncbi:hypothetical protein OPV22_002233 [Ensete ventricosum]|uniref:RING-type domain-containing protein n=1 Tax=Ensete ventricosum TaxID=4639 RepID=A0AAV8RXB7_ENSVE|nr:hypothetical protein OPV22_002233 [Ensete ventricosum]
MSAIFIVFVCTRLLCGCIRSTDSRATPLDLELRSEVDQLEHTIGGLEPVLVAATPTMKYKWEAFSSREDAQCSICLGEYKEKEYNRCLLPSRQRIERIENYDEIHQSESMAIEVS